MAVVTVRCALIWSPLSLLPLLWFLGWLPWLMKIASPIYQCLWTFCHLNRRQMAKRAHWEIKESEKVFWMTSTPTKKKKVLFVVIVCDAQKSASCELTMPLTYRTSANEKPLIIIFIHVFMVMLWLCIDSAQSATQISYQMQNWTRSRITKSTHQMPLNSTVSYLQCSLSLFQRSRVFLHFAGIFFHGACAGEMHFSFN